MGQPGDPGLAGSTTGPSVTVCAMSPSRRRRRPKRSPPTCDRPCGSMTAERRRGGPSPATRRRPQPRPTPGQLTPSPNLIASQNPDPALPRHHTPNVRHSDTIRCQALESPDMPGRLISRRFGRWHRHSPDRNTRRRPRSPVHHEVGRRRDGPFMPDARGTLRRGLNR